MLSDGRSNPEVVGSIPTEVKIFFLYLVWFPDSLSLGLTPSGFFMGSISTLVYTSELILCFTIVHYCRVRESRLFDGPHSMLVA